MPDLPLWFTNILSVLEFIIAAITVCGFLYGGFIWIIRPIKKLIADAKTNADQNTKIIKILDEKIIPFIDRMDHDFSPNSGKSMRDCIDRIDDSIRLGELRSKMISNSLVSTGTYECDADGNWTWVNNALVEMFGMSKDEMLHQGWLMGVKHTERQHVWEQWHIAIKNDIPYEAEYTVVNQKTRVESKVRVTAVAHKNLDGQVLGFYGSLLPI
jgi:PAS domain S-box-containing protein